jgi:hypothetical protein
LEIPFERAAGLVAVMQQLVGCKVLPALICQLKNGIAQQDSMNINGRNMVGIFNVFCIQKINTFLKKSDC